MQENYYVTLGLKPTGLNEAGKPYTKKELKKTFREQSLKYHPDKNQDDTEAATTQFQKIKNAYDILSNPKKRAEFDKELSTNPSAFADDVHIFFTSEEPDEASGDGKPRKLNLTQLMADASISPETILHAAAENTELAQAILDNVKTRRLLPLAQQFELLFIVCTQLNDDLRIKALLDSTNITLLFRQLSSQNHESAFCNACFKQAHIFSFIINNFIPFLEKLSDKSLLLLGSKFYEAASVLLKKQSTTLRLRDLLFLLKNYPHKNQALLDCASENLREKFETYKSLLADETFLSRKEELQKLGIDALCLTAKDDIQITIAKILFEDRSNFLATLETEDNDILLQLVIKDFKQSKKLSEKDSTQKTFHDTHLVFNRSERAIVFEAFPLNVGVYLLTETELDRFDPENVAEYVDFILSYRAAGKTRKKAEEESPVLSLTHSAEDAVFFEFVKHNYRPIFRGLERGRALLIGMLNVHANDLASLPEEVLKRLAHLCFVHKIEPVPEIFQASYKAVEELYGHINKPKEKKAKKKTEVIPKDKEEVEKVEEVTEAVTEMVPIAAEETAVEPPKDKEEAEPKKDEEEKPAGPQKEVEEGEEEEEETVEEKPVIESGHFLTLFETSGFFFDLLFLNTNDNEIRLKLIEDAVHELNNKAQIEYNTKEKFEELIQTILIEGTPEQIGKLLNLLSGKNSHYISDVLLDDSFNLMLKMFPDKVTSEDMAFQNAAEYLKKLSFIQSILFHSPSEIDKYTSSAGLAKLKLPHHRRALMYLMVQFLSDIKLTDLNPNDLPLFHALLKLCVKEVTQDTTEETMTIKIEAYPAVLALFVKRAELLMHTHPQYKPKVSLAWITVRNSDWFKAKVSAYHELEAFLANPNKQAFDCDKSLLALIEILKRTNIDQHTVKLLVKNLEGTLLREAILLLMRESEEFIIFDDAREILKDQRCFPRNPDYQVECCFYTIAAHTICFQQTKTPSAALLKMVQAHGDKILHLLEQYNLTTRTHRNRKLVETLSTTTQKKNKFETRLVNVDEIIEGLLREFKILVNTCPPSDLIYCIGAQALFEKLVRTQKEIQSPKLQPLCDAYPAEDKKNLLLWVTTLAIQENLFAKTTFNQWINSADLSAKAVLELGKVCQTEADLKKLLAFEKVSELPQALLNTLLSNNAIFNLIISEFLSNIKDLVSLKDFLTLSNRDRIAAHLLKQENALNLPLIYGFFAIIKTGSIAIHTYFSPDTFCLGVAEAYFG
jgi:curved DNA-binding protein CbpA